MLQRQKRACMEPAQYHRLKQRDDEGFTCTCRSLVTGQCHKRNSYIPEKFISRTFRNHHGSWPRYYSQVWPWTPIVYTGLAFELMAKRKQEKQTAEITQTKWKPESTASCAWPRGMGNYKKKQMATMSAMSNMHFQRVNYSFPKPLSTSWGCDCGLEISRWPWRDKHSQGVRSTLGGQAVSRVGRCGSLRSRGWVGGTLDSGWKAASSSSITYNNHYL